MTKLQERCNSKKRKFHEETVYTVIVYAINANSPTGRYAKTRARP